MAKRKNVYEQRPFYKRTGITWFIVALVIATLIATAFGVVGLILYMPFLQLMGIEFNDFITGVAIGAIGFVVVGSVYIYLEEKITNAR